MRFRTRIFGPVVLAMSLSTLAGFGSQRASGEERAARRDARTPAPPASRLPARPIPPYHKNVRQAKPFPALVPASHFGNYPVVARAYEIAHEIPGVLAQQPCYCNCDKFFGHGSLLDCFASDHTAGCAICVKEAFFTFQQTKQGKTAPEIRQAIIRGDYQKVDINKLAR